jgi:MoxR-like ATPase
MEIQDFSKTVLRIEQEIAREVIGLKDIIRHVLIAVISGGNVLLEGVPGLGKTRLVKTLGRVLDLDFNRIQFTPDLMPSDVVGTNILVKDEKGNSAFRFQAGPIFSNLVLADEINRATPKTQSAMLEAMQEHTVTVGGVTRALPEPYYNRQTADCQPLRSTFCFFSIISPMRDRYSSRFFTLAIRSSLSSRG